MCLIAIKGAGVALPKEKYMLHAEKRNSDGIGVMWWKPTTTDVHIKKDFKDAEEMVKWSTDNISVDDVLVVHFRLATHGLKDIGNRHPFPITKNADLLRKPELVCQVGVAHNGIISQYGHHAKYSDTQKFVLDILADDCVKNNLDNEAVQKLINAFIDGDKLAILRNDGVCYRFGDWELDAGIYYSNDGYKPYEWSFGRGWSDARDWRDNFHSEQHMLENKTLNSSVGAEHQAWIAECDGCHERKLIRYVEINDSAYSLCKKCRKEFRKGRLTEEAICDIESESTCDSCGEFTPEKELVPIEAGFKICKVCNLQYINGGIASLERLQDY